MRGLSAPTYTVLTPILFNELLPLEYSGFFGSVFYVFICLGINISYVFGFDWVADWVYFVLLFPIIIEAFRLIVLFFFFNFKSPHIVFQNSHKKVKCQSLSLEKYEKMIPIQDTSETLKIAFLNNVHIGNLKKTFYTAEYREMFVKEHFDELQKQYETKIAKSDLIEETQMPIKLGFSKKYKKQFFLALMLNFLNQASGVNAIAIYSSNIFKFLGYSSMASSITLIFGGISPFA